MVLLILLFPHKRTYLVNHIRHGINNMIHRCVSRLHLQQFYFVAGYHKKTDWIQGNTGPAAAAKIGLIRFFRLKIASAGGKAKGKEE